MSLNENGGIEFSITGKDGLKTTASGTKVEIGMTGDLKNKIDKLDNLADNAENTYATKSELDNKADKKLSNITVEGKKVIKGLIKVSSDTDTDNIATVTGGTNTDDENAKDYKISVKKSKVQEIAKDAVEVTSDNGSGITVTPDKKTDANKTTYKLSLDGAKIKELAGTTNIATEYAKIDASNLDETDKTTNRDKWINKLGATSINKNTTDNSKNGKLTTEKAVVDYVKQEIDTVNKNIGNNTIAYKANSGDSKTTSLTNGFNFSDGTNTAAEVGENGVVKFNLKDKLTGITSIEKGDNKAKITLNDDNITVNTKITGLTDGTISASSTDAVNGKQLNTVKTTADEAKSTADTVSGKITALEGKKLGFTGNSGNKIEKKLGEDIAIEGDDSSITTEAKNNAITIKVKDKGITSAKIADKAVGTTQLDDKVVTTDKIADKNITEDKLAEGL